MSTAAAAGAVARMLPRERMLAQAAATPAGHCGMLVLRLRDIDEYRIDHGYAAAEALELAAAALVPAVLRPDDRCCRLGEHTFAVWMPGLRNPQHARLAAQRLLRAFHQELVVGDHRVPVDLAIGLANGEDSSDAEGLLRQADLAALEALRRHVQVEEHLGDPEQARIPTEILRSAIAGNRMEVWMQPLRRIRDGALAGIEALARWHSQELGVVSPSRFVIQAEHSELIGEFTRWNFNASLRQFAAIHARRPELYLSINFSPRLFDEDGIVDEVLAALALWGVPAKSVVLEVTETAITSNLTRSAALLQRLRDAGMGIAVDDFGTGYASFAYLKHFPATALKIDQSFVRDMCRVERSRQLVRAMIDLAHHLDISVVAEGVEDAATLELLANMDCDLAQGFHVGRPIPAEAILESL